MKMKCFTYFAIQPFIAILPINHKILLIDRDLAPYNNTEVLVFYNMILKSLF